MSVEKEIILPTLFPLQIICRMVFFTLCGRGKGLTVFSHKNVSSPVQSRKTVWALKTLSIWALSIFFMKKKNNPWQKFYCPQKAQLLARKKSSGWDNVAVDIRQWQERKSCNVKMLLMHLLLPKAKTPLSSATT